MKKLIALTALLIANQLICMDDYFANWQTNLSDSEGFAFIPFDQETDLGSSIPSSPVFSNEEVASSTDTLLSDEPVHQSTHKHRDMHTKTKPHVCGICDKKFAKLSHLSRHEQTHIPKKPLYCMVCAKSFKAANNLAQHMKTHTQKGHTCDVCGKICARPSELIIHERTHSKEKPFSCDICDLSFASSSSLKSHKNIHTQEKTYVCDICGHKFTRPYTLKRHKSLMHDKNSKKRAHQDHEDDYDLERPAKIPKPAENTH